MLLSITTVNMPACHNNMAERSGRFDRGGSSSLILQNDGPSCKHRELATTNNIPGANPQWWSVRSVTRTRCRHQRQLHPVRRHRLWYVSARCSFILLLRICLSSALNSTNNNTTKFSVPTIVKVRRPSALPSWVPSPAPTRSSIPSTSPSLSHAPSASSPPTQVPSRVPKTVSPAVTSLSAEPSLVPSLATAAPTPGDFVLAQSPLLSMTLLGIESNVSSFVKEWRNTTSQHVRQFWLGFGNKSPFFIGRVVTTLVAEARLRPPDATLGWNSTSSTTSDSSHPDPLQINYTQEINYLVIPGQGDPAFAHFQEADLFTIPFEQDGISYTRDLRKISNNTQIIFLIYTGVVRSSTPTMAPVIQNGSDDWTVVYIVVAVVVLALLFAIGYLVHLTGPRTREDEQQQSFVTSPSYKGGGEEVDSHVVASPSSHPSPSIIGSIIGVHANDNIIISESYDDDFYDRTHPNSGSTLRSDPEAVVQDDQVVLPSHGTFADVAVRINPDIPVDGTVGLLGVSEPILENDRGDDSMVTEDENNSSNNWLPPPLLTAPMVVTDLLDSGEHPDRYFINYSPMTSFRSSSGGSQNNTTNPRFTPPSPLMGGGETDDEYDGAREDEAKNNDEDDFYDEPDIPFINGFQLEIQELE